MNNERGLLAVLWCMTCVGAACGGPSPVSIETKGSALEPVETKEVAASSDVMPGVTAFSLGPDFNPRFGRSHLGVVCDSACLPSAIPGYAGPFGQGCVHPADRPFEPGCISKAQTAVGPECEADYWTKAFYECLASNSGNPNRCIPEEAHGSVDCLCYDGYPSCYENACQRRCVDNSDVTHDCFERCRNSDRACIVFKERDRRSWVEQCVADRWPALAAECMDEKHTFSYPYPIFGFDHSSHSFLQVFHEDAEVVGIPRASGVLIHYTGRGASTPPRRMRVEFVVGPPEGTDWTVLETLYVTTTYDVTVELSSSFMRRDGEVFAWVIWDPFMDHTADTPPNGCWPPVWQPGQAGDNNYLDFQVTGRGMRVVPLVLQPQ